jgi:hypothetical protein
VPRLPWLTIAGFAFTFPAIRGRKITAAFDGGRLTSLGGVMLLAQAERRLGIADRLAACIADPPASIRLASN